MRVLKKGPYLAKFRGLDILNCDNFWQIYEMGMIYRWFLWFLRLIKRFITLDLFHLMVLYVFLLEFLWKLGLFGKLWPLLFILGPFRTLLKYIDIFWTKYVKWNKNKVRKRFIRSKLIDFKKKSFTSHKYIQSYKKF